MAGTLSRLARHLFAPDARSRFHAAAMDRIASAIAQGELRHAGEVCFAVESALSWREVLAGVDARERALEAFSRLRVWDTAANNGVLIYLLLAERRIEIVADRGLHERVSEAQWRGVCQLLEEGLRAGDGAQAVVDGIAAASDLLALHFPAATGVAGHDELPDQPVIL